MLPIAAVFWVLAFGDGASRASDGVGESIDAREGVGDRGEAPRSHRSDHPYYLNNEPTSEPRFAALCVPLLQSLFSSPSSPVPLSIRFLGGEEVGEAPEFGKIVLEEVSTSLSGPLLGPKPLRERLGEMMCTIALRRIVGVPHG